MKMEISFRKIYFFVITIVLFSTIVGNSKANNIMPGEDDYIIATEKMPAPIGGLEGIVKKITYPEIAKRTNTEGKVYVLAYINEKGDVDEVKVVKGIGMGCDEEAVKAVKRTKFSPGENKGAPVKAKFSLALTFKL